MLNFFNEIVALEISVIKCYQKAKKKLNTMEDCNDKVGDLSFANL